MSEAIKNEIKITPGISNTKPDRSIKMWHFLVLVVLYLAIVQGLAALLNTGHDASNAVSSVENIIRSIIIPVALASTFTLAIVSYLGAWKEIFTNSLPVRRWLMAIPAILLITIIVITNYPGLTDKGLEFTLLLLVGTLMVGFGEELMFRGLGVIAFRNSGYSEFQVGLWTTIIFAVAHATNIFTAGPSALIQVLATAGTGLIFYFILRSTGALFVAMLAHGLWDFSVLSSQINLEKPWPLVNVSAFVLISMLVGLFIFRKRIVPAQQP